MSAATADRAGLDPEVQGILWMLAAALLFSVTDVVAKHLARDFPILQIVWARLTFHAVLVVLLVHVNLPRHLRTTRVGLQILRSVLLLWATGSLILGLSLMPLAELTAILQLTPLIVTVVAIPALGERVGPRRLTAVLVGFAGALAIVRPGGELWQVSALAPLGAAVGFGVYQVVTRQVSRTDPVLTSMVFTPIVGALATSLALPAVWVAPDLLGWALLAGTGLLGGASQFCLIKSVERTPATVVAPFVYTTMVWAIAFGFLLFGEVPDLWTLLGALLIVSSGVYVIRRESRARP